MSRGETKPCPLCGAEPLTVSRHPDRDALDIECRRCGRFTISGTLYAIGKIPAELKPRLSAYTRQCLEEGTYPEMLHTKNLQSIAERKPELTASQKLHKLLAVLIRKSGYQGASIWFSEEWDYPLIDAKNPEEAVFHLFELQKRGYIEYPAMGTMVVTHEGWEYFQESSGVSSVVPRPGQGEVPRDKEWDVFICHASEDKQEIVERLAQALRERGLKVWYDRWTLEIGDSLRQKIDEGLAKSRYGIVVLSQAFLRKKPWTERELDGLVQKEIVGQKVILPVWHGVMHAEVAQYSLPLADRVAGSTEGGIEALAGHLVRAIREEANLADLSSTVSSSQETATLGQASQDEIGNTLRYLTSSDVDVRRDAAKDLLNLLHSKRMPQSEQFLEAVGGLLSDTDEEVRLDALRTAWRMLTQAALQDRAALTDRYRPVLLKLGEDDASLTVRAQAMGTIGRTGSPQFIDHGLAWIRAWDQRAYSRVNPCAMLVQLVVAGLGTQVKDALRNALEKEGSDLVRQRLKECLREVSSVIR